MTRNRLRSARALRLPWVILWLLAGAGCGGVSPTSHPPPSCSGASCACDRATACEISTDVCGPSCTLTCGAESECRGSCGESCTIDCGEAASCIVTLGRSGSISCKAGSTCEVTCTGDCSLSCADGAVCRLRCPGEAAFESVSGGGGC